MAGVIISYLESSEEELVVTVADEPLGNKETAELELQTVETIAQSNEIIAADSADTSADIGDFQPPNQPNLGTKILSCHNLKPI